MTSFIPYVLAFLFAIAAIVLRRRRQVGDIGMAILGALAVLTMLGGANLDRFTGARLRHGDSELSVEFQGHIVETTPPAGTPAQSSDESQPGQDSQTAPRAAVTRNVERTTTATFGVRFKPTRIGAVTGRYYIADLQSDRPTSDRLSLFVETVSGLNYLAAELLDRDGNAYVIRQPIQDWREGGSYFIAASAGPSTVEERNGGTASPPSSGDGKLMLWVAGHVLQVTIPSWQAPSFGPSMSFGQVQQRP